jgi:transposase InsO family protein
MSLRLEFVKFATAENANVRELCRRFHLSPRTAYKWIKRFRAGGAAALADLSRRPISQPRLTKPQAVERVLKMREVHPTWGGLKINMRLRKLGQTEVPSPSTITQILRRAGRLDPVACAQRVPFQRFQREAPNELWQMDFKGHFPLAQGRCHPLAAVDDHSRYALILAACPNEQGSTVQALLQSAFQIYGCPWSILADNGAPWGCSSGPDHYTTLGVWILRLGIKLIHGAPAHPQTQGKEERFNRTLKSDVLSRQDWRDLPQCAQAFHQWRQVYNHERPHQAIGLETPAHFYRPSPRLFPAALPAIQYGPDDLVKKVKSKGEITLANQTYYIGRAFAGLPVALRPTTQDGLLEVRFCQQKLGQINLKEKAQSKWTYQSIRP